MSEGQLVDRFRAQFMSLGSVFLLLLGTMQLKNHSRGFCIRVFTEPPECRLAVSLRCTFIRVVGRVRVDTWSLDVG